MSSKSPPFIGSPETEEDDYGEAEDFDESLLGEIEETIPVDLTEFKSVNSAEIDCCLHKNVVKDGNIEKCSDCGLETFQEMSLEPEWRYYDNDNKNSSDPARCHVRKDDVKTIYPDLRGLGLSKEIMQEANRLYYMVTKNQIKRANLRKAIIYACVFNAFKYLGDNNMPDDLDEKFELTRKAISRGLKHFHMSIEKRIKPTYISPSVYIIKIMKKFKAGQMHITRVEKLYDIIQNKSITVKRCNPQSVIAGLIYYYWKLLSLGNIGYDITCAKFSSIVGLSEITVTRVAKEISKLLGTDQDVKLV